ncbi:MAG TPA: hypothetical protein DEB39_06755 [Planctomycetaceae bacterium]|nr:hypothetical protein [Planctomycetaceae bacterium]
MKSELWFGFDGHGSTRVLMDVAGAIAQLFAYDAYGQAIGFNPADALTEFLYSGEQFDAKIGQQYLRARYYDPATGTFNRLDPFFGNLNDPQSLHNYLYCHGDPLNYKDPNGEFTVVEALAVLTLIGLILGLYWTACTPSGIALRSGLSSTPMDQETLNTAITEMRRPFFNGTRMTELADKLEENPRSIDVFVLPGGTSTAGLNFAGARKIYVSEDYLENPLEGALVLFGEYQHITSEQGTLNEQEAQIEFNDVRNRIPANQRTVRINNLNHGH